MLNVLDDIDEETLLLPAEALHSRLPGPSLIHFKGRRERPVFISVLLHGNEHTGWEAVRQLLLKYRDRQLPRDLSLFIGNVHAARYGQRFLDGQRDYNRVWEGDESSPEHHMMQQIISQMRARNVFISIDIHNNTGKNPHYACVNKIDGDYLYLGSLFSRTMVYFIRPRGVQSMAFARLCPAVTVECGLSGERSGIDRAAEFIDACLHLDSFPARSPGSHDIDLYHTVATVKIPERYQFGFDHQDYDLRLDEAIEFYNFRELPPNTVMGEVKTDGEIPLVAIDEEGNDVGQDFFAIANGKLVSRKSLIPAMITLNTDVIRKDCLCYLMEHYPLPE